MNDITFIQGTVYKVLTTTEQNRDDFTGLQYAVGKVHVKIQHHGFAALPLGFTEGSLDAVLALNALAVAEFSIDGIFWIFVAIYSPRKVYLCGNYFVPLPPQMNADKSNSSFHQALPLTLPVMAGYMLIIHLWY